MTVYKASCIQKQDMWIQNKNIPQEIKNLKT